MPFRQNEGPNKPYPSRLAELMDAVRKRARFWDKVSISISLALCSIAGTGLFSAGIMSLARGQLILRLSRTGAELSGWSMTLMCWSFITLGITMVLPLPMYWLAHPRTTTIAVGSGFIVSLIIFVYAFAIHALSNWSTWS